MVANPEKVELCMHAWADGSIFLRICTLQTLYSYHRDAHAWLQAVPIIALPCHTLYYYLVSFISFTLASWY